MPKRDDNDVQDQIDELFERDEVRAKEIFELREELRAQGISVARQPREKNPKGLPWSEVRKVRAGNAAKARAALAKKRKKRKT